MTQESSILCAYEETIENLVAEREAMENYFRPVMQALGKIFKEGGIHTGMDCPNGDFGEDDALFIVKAGRYIQLRESLGLDWRG